MKNINAKNLNKLFGLYCCLNYDIMNLEKKYKNIFSS